MVMVRESARARGRRWTGNLVIFLLSTHFAVTTGFLIKELEPEWAYSVADRMLWAVIELGGGNVTRSASTGPVPAAVAPADESSATGDETSSDVAPSFGPPPIDDTPRVLGMETGDITAGVGAALAWTIAAFCIVVCVSSDVKGRWVAAQATLACLAVLWAPVEYFVSECARDGWTECGGTFRLTRAVFQSLWIMVASAIGGALGALLLRVLR